MKGSLNRLQELPTASIRSMPVAAEDGSVISSTDRVGRLLRFEARRYPRIVSRFGTPWGVWVA
jgi:hypothetical protein